MPPSLFVLIKHLHVMCVTLSFFGYLLRLFWHYSNSPYLKKPITKILPHVIDTLLLATGISLAITLHYSPFHAFWFSYKLIAVISYILLGLLAFKIKKYRTPAAAAAIIAFFVSAYLAVNKLV